MKKEVNLHSTMDAKIWAEEFMKYFYNILFEFDEGVMLSWFANAIMTGYDHSSRRSEEKINKLKSLLLLTDPAVSNVEMNDLSLKQWNEYTKWEEKQ